MAGVLQMRPLCCRRCRTGSGTKPMHWPCALRHRAGHADNHTSPPQEKHLRVGQWDKHGIPCCVCDDTGFGTHSFWQQVNNGSAVGAVRCARGGPLQRLTTSEGANSRPRKSSPNTCMISFRDCFLHVGRHKHFRRWGLSRTSEDGVFHALLMLCIVHSQLLLLHATGSLHVQCCGACAHEFSTGSAHTPRR